MTADSSDTSAVADLAGPNAIVKDNSSTSQTLTGHDAAPREPASEEATKPESPRSVHGTKVRERYSYNIDENRGLLTSSIAVVSCRRLSLSIVPALRSRHHHRGHHPARHRRHLWPRRSRPLAQRCLCPLLSREHAHLVQDIWPLLCQEAFPGCHRAVHGCVGPLWRRSRHDRLYHRACPCGHRRHRYVHGPPHHPLRQHLRR